MKSKFQDFLIDEENKDLCQKMMKKFQINERRCLSIIEYLRMMDKLTEKNLENAIHVLDIKNRNVKEYIVKINIYTTNQIIIFKIIINISSRF